MGSLQTSRNLSRRGVKVVREVGVSWLLQGPATRKIKSLRVRSLFIRSGGGNSTDGSSKGLLLGSLRDASGSVGFELTPNSALNSTDTPCGSFGLYCSHPTGSGKAPQTDGTPH